MKTAGIIGGMSWESTAKYYQWLNEGVRGKLGGLHSAKLVLTSVDFAEIEKLQAAGKWNDAGDIMTQEAKKLEAAGADFILLATNTMHKVADRIESAVNIPFIHLADATADKIRDAGLECVGLLGTRYTMEHDFYKNRLAQKNLKVIVPAQADRQITNAIIFDELCMGMVRPESKAVYMRAAHSLIDQGAQGIILGCTEITLLLDQADFDLPVFDTTKIHIAKALGLMLS
jgi:aspartate racemase